MAPLPSTLPSRHDSIQGGHFQVKEISVWTRVKSVNGRRGSIILRLTTATYSTSLCCKNVWTSWCFSCRQGPNFSINNLPSYNTNATRSGAKPGIELKTCSLSPRKAINRKIQHHRGRQETQHQKRQETTSQSPRWLSLKQQKKEKKRKNLEFSEAGSWAGKGGGKQPLPWLLLFS